MKEAQAQHEEEDKGARAAAKRAAKQAALEAEEAECRRLAREAEESARRAYSAAKQRRSMDKKRKAYGSDDEVQQKFKQVMAVKRLRSTRRTRGIMRYRCCRWKTMDFGEGPGIQNGSLKKNTRHVTAKTPAVHQKTARAQAPNQSNASSTALFTLL